MFVDNADRRGSNWDQLELIGRRGVICAFRILLARFARDGNICHFGTPRFIKFHTSHTTGYDMGPL
jgi:hypothetical protein